MTTSSKSSNSIISVRSTPAKFLSSNTLKLIAIVAMTIDHLADVFTPVFSHPDPVIFSLLHIIGRLTAPIMFFCICEGFAHTKNLPRYLLRLFGFALISHFAFCFAFDCPMIPFSNGEFLDQTSVIWGLAWSVVALWVVYGTHRFNLWQRILLICLICLLTLPADWGCISVLAVLIMYAFRGHPAQQTIGLTTVTITYCLICSLFFRKDYGPIPAFVILVYPLLASYNGQRGRTKWLKWFFYLYYPLHLAVIGLIRVLLVDNVPIF